MHTVNLKGNPFGVSGQLPKAGDPAPDFTVTGGDLKDLTLADFAGKRVVLNIFPSVDTPVCATTIRRFNEAAANLANTEVLCISRDLPFALSRFCGAEGIEGVTCASSMRDGSFGDDYGIQLVDGPLAGLFARAVVVIGEDGTVLHSQLVPEITVEPDYDDALGACS